VSVSSFLKLRDLPFIGSGPPLCSAFARAERKGKSEIDLSGSTMFNQVVLPLASSIQHLRDSHAHLDATNSIFLSAAFCVCVLDGPMVCVGGDTTGPSLEMRPWVRVVRQQAQLAATQPSSLHHVVDFVHRHFLAEFVEKHLFGFADEFARCAFLVEPLLKRGGVEVPDLANWEFDQLCPSTTAPEPRSEEGL
jgi:hypothetical protein